MRRVVLLLASTALAVLLLFGVSGNSSRETQTTTAKPNFVFILADDMRKDDLRYMPKTRSVLKNKGMSFQSAFVSNALCCPSRATIMRGQYAHNTGVWSNLKDNPEGGWRAYKNNGNEQDNVATRLDTAGYRTALIGKYFNGYWGTYVPRGWDKWFVNFGFKYFDYFVNDNGTIRHFGAQDSDYITDVLRRQIRAFIGTSAARGNPFFAYVAPIAPHEPATPAPRDLHTHHGGKVARPPSFNEKDVSNKSPGNERGISDKPLWIRSRPRLNADQIAQLDRRHERRVEALQALDDLVEGVVNKLKKAGVMSNTYVFFTSDNGWAEGEHRRANGKAHPYEEDIHIPLLVRGPGVAAGSTTHKMALNTDYLPTLTGLAGVQTPSYVDGRSLRPVLEGNVSTWRNAILLENHEGPWEQAAAAYYGIRTGNGRKYVEYADGFRELYDLNADPYELINHYDAATPPEGLARRLAALKGCSGDTCRKAENEL